MADGEVLKEYLQPLSVYNAVVGATGGWRASHSLSRGPAGTVQMGHLTRWRGEACADARSAPASMHRNRRAAGRVHL